MIEYRLSKKSKQRSKLSVFHDISITFHFCLLNITHSRRIVLRSQSSQLYSNSSWNWNAQPDFSAMHSLFVSHTHITHGQVGTCKPGIEPLNSCKHTRKFTDRSNHTRHWSRKKAVLWPCNLLNSAFSPQKRKWTPWPHIDGQNYFQY